MKRYTYALIVSVLCSTALQARHDRQSCGTHPDKLLEQLHLHKLSAKARATQPPKARALSVAGESLVNGVAIRPDNGNIAILDDSDGVMARRNLFDLSPGTLTFTPTNPNATTYRYAVGPNSYDSASADAGTELSGLGDDDSREIDLPFDFPFYGQKYRKVFVNSDGNLTFGAADVATSDRSLGRMTSGQPRIAPLFEDLDPTQSSRGVRVLSAGNQVVVSWPSVPLFADFGSGPLQTFQIRLHSDGKIEFALLDIRSTSSVVGISPGHIQGQTSVVDFSTQPSAEYNATVAERFATASEIDIISAAQKFYLNHDDSFDYLVIYNTLNVAAGDGAVAYEVTVRNDRTGYGDVVLNNGAQTGSKKRLQAIINMGPLSQYPRDINAKVPARLSVGDTPLTTIAHEAGHLFLAFASVRDENNSDARPMLGYQTAHWNFRFNSDASLLEGNRIRDNGPGANPRFQTVAAVEAFSPLDQYLMGFLPADQVPNTFLVENSTLGSSYSAPQVGVTFNGTRRDISVQDIIAAEGRRTPDHTVAQRRFRMAFILVTAAGQEPTADQLSQVETYRREFEPFFSRVSSGNAFADTSLKPALQLTTSPAAGVVEGGTGQAKVQLASAPTAPLTVFLRTTGTSIEVPQSISVPAGVTEASFTIRGVRGGVSELIAEASTNNLDAAHSKIQVLAPAGVQVTVANGDFQAATPGRPLPNAVQFQVTDANQLPYPGVTLQITPTEGGTVDQQVATTDEKGMISVRWTPGSAAVNELRAAVASGPTATATALGKPSIAAAAVVNAASFASGLAPGAIATIFGANLSAGSGAEVSINGQSAVVYFASTRQINFLVPSGIAAGSATVQVTNTAGTSDQISVPVTAIQPAIFFDAASNYGAILIAGTRSVTQVRPARAGETIEIYSTGLGALRTRADGLRETITTPQVTIDGRPAEVTFSGLNPAVEGLNQINVRIPDGLAPGDHALVIQSAGVVSNSVKVRLQ